MKRLGLFIALGLILGVAAIQPVVADTPNPVTCEGYPERRVYMENQSWVSPQPGPVGHPGTGQVGHIHISTCFPLLQSVTSPTLSLDVRLQMHNVPGTPVMIDARTYNLRGPNSRMQIPYTEPCPVADCDRWVHIDFPLSKVEESGWTEFHINLHVNNTNGQRWYNVTRWYFEVVNGAPPRDPLQTRIGGDTWLPQAPSNTNYSEARIMEASFPWNFQTGEMIPVSGVWKPLVWFAGEGRVLIDPALHATPPNFGTEIWRGYPVSLPGTPKRMMINVDTTKLTDGPHRMLLISCDHRTNGVDNCGVLVVPFIVDN